MYYCGFFYYLMLSDVVNRWQHEFDYSPSCYRVILCFLSGIPIKNTLFMPEKAARLPPRAFYDNLILLSD